MTNTTVENLKRWTIALELGREVTLEMRTPNEFKLCAIAASMDAADLFRVGQAIDEALAEATVQTIAIIPSLGATP